MDASTEGTCLLNFTCSEDASAISARVELPSGFEYAGHERLLMDGTASPCPPAQRDRTVEWDLSNALRARKHVIINEWDQNPKGNDYGREWIELYNPALQAEDISGWKIADSQSGREMPISSDTVIAAGDYLLLNWTQKSLINSNYTCLILRDGAGREVDRTSPGKDDKNSDHCWARYPDGKDLDCDLDWRFMAATPGSSNGGSPADIYSGQSLALQFNITAGCEAALESRLSASIGSASGTSASSEAAVAVRRANISLSVTPDRYDVARGDAISWCLLLENMGDGAARAVAVNATLAGQQVQGTDPPGENWYWSIPFLPPGGREEITFKSKVASSRESYRCHFSASWGRPAPCESESQIVDLGQRTAIRKSPDEPRRLAVGDAAGFTISADLPGGARDMWINDTIPRGLLYNDSSLSLQGLSLEREVRSAAPDGALLICWHLRDSPSARQAEIAYNCLVENAEWNQDGTEISGAEAAMSWTEAADGASGATNADRKSDSDASGPITVIEPELSFQMSATPPVASPGDLVTFTLAAGHTPTSSSTAYDLDLQILLPPGLAYQPGSAVPQASFEEEALCWHLAEIGLDGASEWRDALVPFSFNATCQAQPGCISLARARLTWSSRPGECLQERGGSGGVNDYQREAAAGVAAASLTLTKAADPDPVEVGKTLTYTLTYEYRGDGPAHNAVICDELDPGVELLSAEPSPSRIDDAKLIWTVPLLENNSIERITIAGHVSESAPDGALLQNSFNISCDELGALPAKSIFTTVHNGSRLAVSKTALQKAVRHGEVADFVITVCNRGGQAATNITVRDVFDSTVEVVSVWPEPSGDGLWRFGSLEPGACLQMGLSARVPRTDVAYESHQNISGRGFIRAYRDYSTSRPPGLLSNQVYVTADGTALSASASVSILAEQGTGLYIREHGSGGYSSLEGLEYLTANKSVRMEREIDAEYQPASIPLPGGRELNASCLWNDQVLAKNGITNTTMLQSYRCARRLKEDGSLALDENESNIRVISSFDGVARLAARKTQEGQFYSSEQYAGGFRLFENLYDAGQGLLMDRAASGFGYVSRDAAGKDGKGRALKSGESGTGSFQAEERTDTYSCFMDKELNASFAGVSLPVTPRTALQISQRWSEEMASATDHSLIEEKYSSAARLDMKTTASSPWERQSEAAFSGAARMRTLFTRQNNSSRSLDVDSEESYQGDFFIKRRIILSGPARFDRPHLYLAKEGRLAGDVAAYTITMENDGNAALGPLYLQDIFPPGATFINSSLRPGRIAANSSNWTLLHLAIGDKARIDVNLDAKNCSGDIINRVAVLAECSRGPVAAENRSVIFRESIGCCPPDFGDGNCSGQYAAAAPAFGCACLEKGEDWDTDADFLSQDQLTMLWGEEEGSCPLSCPDLEEGHNAVK